MQESANLLSFRSVHLKHLLREEGEQVVDDIGTLRIGGEMVFHEAEDAVGLSFVEAELVERFRFFELMVAFVGRGREVDAADWKFPNCCYIKLREIIALGNFGKPNEYL